MRLRQSTAGGERCKEVAMGNQVATTIHYALRPSGMQIPNTKPGSKHKDFGAKHRRQMG